MTGPGIVADASSVRDVGRGGAAALLEVTGVSASYSSYRALFGVSFSVSEHGIVALLGSNGAGKSTVARVVSGLVTPTEGTVTFDGQDITDTPAHQIARMGLVHVPEGRGVFSSLSVEENLIVAFRQEEKSKAGVKAALERAYEAFPILGERRRQQAGTLSGGQQRMLTLGRALATPPRLLVVDELSLGLAPVIVDAVYDGLVRIRDAGTALLVVEQQIDRALGIADEAVLLAKGAVAWQGDAGGAATAMDRLLAGDASGTGSVVSGEDLVEALSEDDSATPRS
jgi:branched-chain amino acid transport system ATP-binding protein